MCVFCLYGALTPTLTVAHNPLTLEGEDVAGVSHAAREGRRRDVVRAGGARSLIIRDDERRVYAVERAPREEGGGGGEERVPMAAGPQDPSRRARYVAGELT